MEIDQVIQVPWGPKMVPARITEIEGDFVRVQFDEAQYVATFPVPTPVESWGYSRDEITQ